MHFLGHAALFFLAGFVGYLLNANRGSPLGIFLLIALPVAGVYFLGWWAILTFFVGSLFGGRVFWSAVRSGRINPGE